MPDVHKELVQERFSDAALELLLSEYAEAEGKALVQKVEESCQKMPQQLDAACRASMQKQYDMVQKHMLLHRTARRSVKIAAVFAIFLLLSANLILSVEAIRVPFLNLCLSTQRYFSTLSFSTEDTSSTEADPDTVSLPIDPPRGYTLVVQQHNHEGYSLIYDDSILSLAYQDADGHLYCFHTLPAQGSFSIDTEDAQCTEFLLNGLQAIQIRKETDGSLRVIWVDPERQRLFDVSCDGMTEDAFKEHIQELSAMLRAPEFYAE